MQARRQGPDFICIGMPASGTRWLYDNLQAHDDIHMPMIKELHFLDRGIRDRTVKNRLHELEQKETQGKSIDPCDRAFLDRYAKCEVYSELAEAEKEFHREYKYRYRIRTRDDTPFQPQDSHFDFYDSLFECYRPKKTGDITPGYFAINSDTIAAFHCRYPDVRYFAMVRDPVQRMVSSLNKKVHQGFVTLDDAKQMIVDPKHLARTFRKFRQSHYITKWSEIVGRDAVMVLTLDDVKSDPDRVREDIFAFLGLSSDPTKIDLSATGNRKENQFPKLLSDVDTSRLREAYDEEIKRCQAMIGGATLNW